MANPEITIDGTRYLTTKLAAHQAGLSHDYVARLAREGDVAAYQDQRVWYVDPISLQHFVATNYFENTIRAHITQVERAAEQSLHQDLETITTTTVLHAHVRNAQAQAAAIVLGACMVGLGYVGLADRSVVATTLHGVPGTAAVAASEEGDSPAGSGVVTTELATGEIVESRLAEEATESLLPKEWVRINARELGAVWVPYFDPLRTYVRSWFAEPVTVVWQQPEAPANGLLLPTTTEQPSRPVAFIAESDRERPERDK